MTNEYAKLSVRKLPLSRLKPHPKNPRKHPEPGTPAWETLKRSLQNDYFDPIIVNERNGHFLVSGHLRTKVLAEMGVKYADCVVVDYDEPTHEARMIAANNQIGEWDDVSLAAMLKQCDDIALASMTDDQFRDLLGETEPEKTVDAEPQIDRAEELRKQWGVERGQIWTLGNHRLMCGDSTNADDVGKLMDGQKADMMITDPPYGVAYVGKTKDALTIESDNVDEETLARLCKEWFDRAEEVSRPGSYWIATVPAVPLHGVFFFDWKRRGILRQVMVWNKDSMVLGHSEYHYKHEPILFGWIHGDRLKNADRTKTTVWDFPRPKASREHPTMKPVEMWAYAIRNHTNSGDLLYEPFSGSGTTIVACEQLDRRCFAMEIDPGYVAVALQRFTDATGKTPTLT